MKLPKLLIAGVLVLLGSVVWVGQANAQSFHSGNTINVPASKSIHNTFFASGKSINIAGKIDGDVFCMGQNITVSGTVTGDVICAGQTITLSGKIEGDVRAGAQSVNLSGQVGGNLTAATQTFNSENGSRINGDASLAGQDIVLNGRVGRDLAVAAGTQTINGIVGRNVTSEVKKLTLGSEADISGNVKYTSEHRLETEKGASVSGKINRQQPSKKDRDHKYGSLVGFSAGVAVYLFLSMMLIALALVLVMPRVFQSATERGKSSLGKTFLVGLGTSVVVPVFIVALMLSVIGIPLALLGWLAWFGLLALSGPFAAYLLGRSLLKNSSNAIEIMLLGSAILLLLYFVPFVGLVVLLVAIWFGLGTIILYLTNRTPRPRYEFSTVDDSARAGKTSSRKR